MRINILVNNVFDGWQPTDARLGGTEESVVEWAAELATREHEVHVFHNSPNSSWHEFSPNGVGNKGTASYWPREYYLEQKRFNDVCINIKSPEVAPKEPTFYLTNETDAGRHDLSAYEGVIWPSKWAADNIPVNNPKLYILPHGYNDKLIYPDKKVSKQCFYASSPDRGLDVLLEAWPSVSSAVAEATLLLTYGAPVVDMDGVINMGEVDVQTMNEIYRTSQYWLHPCTGGELYCMVGVKAQAAGCWPVIIPTMALSETVKYGTFSSKETYAEDLIKALAEPPSAPHYDYPNWSSSTDELLNILQNVVL